MTDDSGDGNDSTEPYEKSLKCDLVEVEVSGPDPDRVAEEFADAVEQAFERYDDHVTNGTGGPP